MFSGGAAENQNDWYGRPQQPSDPVMNEMTQIDQDLAAMFAEGPGDPNNHYANMMNAQYTRVGVGLLEVSGVLYLTNDFSN